MKTRQKTFRIILILAAAILSICAFALRPVSASAADPEQMDAEITIAYPADYRNYYRFDSESTSTVNYLLAADDFVVFSDYKTLSVLYTDGTVSFCDVSALSSKPTDRFNVSLYDYEGNRFLFLFLDEKLYYAPLDKNAQLLSLSENVLPLSASYAVVKDNVLYALTTNNKFYRYALEFDGSAFTLGVSMLVDTLRYTYAEPLGVMNGEPVYLSVVQNQNLRIGSNEDAYVLKQKPYSIAPDPTQEDNVYYLFSVHRSNVYYVAKYEFSGQLGVFRVQADETPFLLLPKEVTSVSSLSVCDNTVYVGTDDPACIYRYNFSDYNTPHLSGKICANSDEIDRLSATAREIVEYDGTVYIADTGNKRISSYDRNGEHGVALTLDYEPLYIAVSADYYLTGTETSFSILKKDGTPFASFSESKDYFFKKAAFANNGKFYVLAANATNDKYMMHVYDVTTDAHERVSVAGEGEILSLSTDLSNNVYLLKKSDQGSMITVFGSPEASALYQDRKFPGAIDLRVDFDGNLYLLYENGSIRVFTAENDRELVFQPLKNYSYLKRIAPRALTVSFLGKTTYIIYDGFLIKTDSVVISTPLDIPIPENLDLQKNTTGANYLFVQSGTIFFRFDFVNYQTTGNYTLYYDLIEQSKVFIVLSETDKFYFVLDQTDAGFIRKSKGTAYSVKLETEFPVKEGEKYQTLVGCNLYRFPDLNPIYQVKENGSVLRYAPNTEVSPLRTVTLNGHTFLVVSYQKHGTVAYLPAEFAAKAVDKQVFRSYYYRSVQQNAGNDPTIYDDNSCTNAIKTVSLPAKVKVFYTNANKSVAYVEYTYEEDGAVKSVVGYMPVNFIRNNGSTTALTALLIVLLTVSIVISVAFLFARKNKNKIYED